jgi:hypothetical protein
MRVRVLVLLVSILSVATTASADTSVREKLAARRAKVIERIEAYRKAEVFPTDALGLPLGVFRDDKGVRCPMSELVFLSGRGDLVDAVVKLDNTIKFADIKGGPILDWLLQSGLTQEEAIQIQGAMDWNGRGLQLQGETFGGTQLVNIQPSIDTAHQAVIDKLVAAEEMLKTNTATSLSTAVDRLAVRREKLAAAAKAATTAGKLAAK